MSLEQEGMRPHRPKRAVAGTGLAQLAHCRAGGFFGPAELVAVNADQRQPAVAENEAVALAGLVNHLPARLDLGDRVVPFARNEAGHGADHLVVGQVPADPELLADPFADVEGGSGFIEPVELGEDEPSCDMDRKAVTLPAWALISQANRLIDDLKRVGQVPTVYCDQGMGGHGDACGQVIGWGGGQGFPGGGRCAVEVCHGQACVARPCPRACSLGICQRRGFGSPLQLRQRVALLALRDQGIPQTKSRRPFSFPGMGALQ